MSLYVETTGHGPDLVLLHGWGLHGGLFRPLVEPLSHHFTLHRVDLPGHGRSPMSESEYALTNLADAVAAAVPAGANWLGWSLGGRVAIQAAANSEAINKLILVGANPCFVQRPDWPHAMPEGELQQFADALQGDYRQTLQRFLAVQSRGSERGREELRELRSELFAHGEPQAAALAGGLEILRGVDLRPLLPTIQQPTLVINGSRDTLTPLAAAEYSAAQLPHGQLRLIEGAGHAPFISHPDPFIAAVEAFLDE
ncbi:MAG: pimeloyl-ACP methyl ester esterase BioH [Gammaproteobacteria bacterium]|nr:pimeloyl-ACP methyl ester esterase BioH [Gammaproteobacteria bacterium]